MQYHPANYDLLLYVHVKQKHEHPIRYICKLGINVSISYVHIVDGGIGSFARGF